MTASTISSPPASPSSPPPSPRLYALIPCAGSGSRAGSAGPKQYQAIAGQPMVRHTLAAFAAVARLSACLVVVAPDDDFLPRTDADARTVVAACGGPTRAESVRNGLHALLAQGAAADDWVLVHDAARCLVTPQQIDALIDACQFDAVGGLLALPLPDTLKSEVAGRVAATVDRADKWLAQTPQMFRLGALAAALQRAAVDGFAGITDESSALEAQGLQPLLVRGSAQNFKVTYPEDFALAEAILRSRK
jgi:2-C-methyl-D-erythritol 4-phosphate cytidylyltransferase